jgi:hypothetical protein
MAGLVTDSSGNIEWRKVFFGGLIAAALIAAAVAVGISADAFAAQQALEKAKNASYVPPTSTLPAIATSIMTLASAWSAALVTAVLTKQ